MILQLANSSDAKAISDLLNIAYRGVNGWTTEGHLVAGDRIDINGVELIINTQDVDFLVFRQDREMIACICIQYQAKQAYISSFAVSPNHQAKGFGKAVLNAAEEHAKKHRNISEYAMVVIEERHELIAYYERRGYRRTGKVEPYPSNIKTGLPVVDDLCIVHLLKSISKVQAEII